MGLFRLDYLSCLLTIVATILVTRKNWTGLILSGVNSLVVCVIGVHTSQYGFIPANVFCICIYAFNLKSWLHDGEESRADRIGTLAQAELAGPVSGRLLLHQGANRKLPHQMRLPKLDNRALGVNLVLVKGFGEERRIKAHGDFSTRRSNSNPAL